MENNDQEDIKPESEARDISQADFTFTPNEIHDWRQQGPYLVCKSCELTHGVYIGMDRVLIGLDDEGKPILKLRGRVSK